MLDAPVPSAAPTTPPEEPPAVAAGLTVDVTRTVEELLGLLPLDFVHVHEPFAPSTASAALRHSRALNVGSFHAPAERVISTQVARRFVELFFGRLDARIASFAATAALMESHFPAYALPPGDPAGCAGPALRRPVGRSRRRAPSLACPPPPPLRAPCRSRRAARLRGGPPDGERGLLFAPGDVDTLAAQLERLAADRDLCARLAAASTRCAPTAPRRASSTRSRRSTTRSRRGADPPCPGAPPGRRALIDVDLHMHTDHSPDCATPVEVLLATAREQGLGAIAITDHNEISGALEAAAKTDGIKVIVGEEVKTASQGEVIGLFLHEKIPRGLGLAETIAEIRRQGGLVYVPHPFDRVHTVPGYEHMLAILDEIDAIEIFNPRVAIGSFNEEAARFAAKYRLTPAAGSDSHVAAGLGSVRVRMRDFDGPEEFLDALRDAEIQTRPTSLLYVQALKFLETRATPEGARRARRARRVRRAMRKS